MPKWEHCRVVRGMEHHITYYLTTGVQGGPIKRDKSQGDKDDEDAVARYIVQLGQNGWELAGVSNHGFLQWLYFRRPIP